MCVSEVGREGKGRREGKAACLPGKGRGVLGREASLPVYKMYLERYGGELFSVENSQNFSHLIFSQTPFDSETAISCSERQV
jgi:hypothetical protein